jgi:hypothetical protein
MSNRAKKRVFEPELKDWNGRAYFLKFDLLGRSAKAASQSFIPSERVLCSLSSGVPQTGVASRDYVGCNSQTSGRRQKSENKAQVSLFFELSGGVEADTQAIRVRPEVKIEAGWPHEGWTDRPVARLQAGQMGRNGSRTVTRLAVIPECSTSSRQSSAWPAQLREQEVD